MADFGGTGSTMELGSLSGEMMINRRPIGIDKKVGEGKKILNQKYVSFSISVAWTYRSAVKK